MSSTKTIEDYKRDVVQLKGMINKLNDKQKDLLKRHDHLKSQLESQTKDNEIGSIVNMIQGTTRIQKIWRGYRTRLLFFKKLQEFQRGNHPQAKQTEQVDLTITESITNRKVVQKINKELVKKTGIDLGMLFRALDDELAQSIKSVKLEQYLTTYIMSNRLKENEIKRLIFLLDEGCSGYISKQEMHTCLSAYGVNFEESSSYSRTIELEVLLNFAYRCKLKGFSAEDTFQIINISHSSIIKQKDLRSFCQKTLQYEISQKEIDALFNSFDLYQNGEVNQKQFIKILAKAIESSSQQQQSQPQQNSKKK